LKKAFVQTYNVSKTFKAPLAFVFDWCTDFREDDGKMTGSKAKMTFLEKTDKRMVWVVDYKEKGKAKEGIRVVWLHPPDSWSLDTCGDGKELGEYKLKEKGNGKTRLDMEFRLTYDNKADVEDKKTWEKETEEFWDVLGQFLEKDYNESLRKSKS
jgi:hypothetical protein